MPLKSSNQLAEDFFKYSAILKASGGDLSNINLHKSKHKLKIFWDKWLKNEGSRRSDSLYLSLYKLLICHPNRDDLYELYLEAQKLRIWTLPYFVFHYGKEIGQQLYDERSKNLSKKKTTPRERNIKRFFESKLVKGKIKWDKLDKKVLLDLHNLLIAKPYDCLRDREPLIVDLVLHPTEDSILDRFEKIIKLGKSRSLKYYEIRYGKNGNSEYQKFVSEKQNQARSNFKNTVEYWTRRGHNIESATFLSHEEQKRRANLAKIKLEGKISTRSKEYWLEQGYSISESNSIITEIQTRDELFFIRKHNCEEEAKKKISIIRSKKVNTWLSRPEHERNEINKSRGRTLKQLINEKGETEAIKIIRSRVEFLKGVSHESKSFFRDLDDMLDPYIKNKSITAYKSEERWISIKSKLYFVDYFVEGCIIEYNGSFWHADNRIFKSTDWHDGAKKQVQEIWNLDEERIRNLKEAGYKVLIIWCRDVKENRIIELQKCKEFINANIKI